MALARLDLLEIDRHIGKKRYFFLGVEQAEIPQYGIIQFIYSCIHAAHSVERIIMEHDHLLL